MGEIFNDSGSFDDVALVPPILQGEYVPSIDTPKIEDGFKLIIPFGGGRTTRSGTEYIVSAEGGATRTDYGSFDSVPASQVSYDLSNLLAPTQVTTVPVPGGIFDLDRTLKQIQVLGTEKDVLVYTSDIITVLEEHTWDEVTPPGEGDSSRWMEAAISDDQMKAVVTKYHPADERAFYFTGDGADNWTEKTLPSNIIATLDMSRDGNMILVLPGSGTEVYISTDDADSWSTKTVAGSSQNWYRCAIDSDGSHQIITSTTNVFVSTDSGENWSDVTPEGGVWVSVACNEDGSVMLASNGSLFLTEDYGSSWSELSPFAIADSCISIAVNDDGTKMVAIDGFTKISISTDGGDTWDESTISGASTAEKVFMNDSGQFILIKQYYGPIIISYDSGNSWTFLGSIEDPEAGYGWTNLVHAINKSTGELALIGYLAIYRGAGSGYPEDYWSETTLTSFARSLIDDSDAATARTTLGAQTQGDVLDDFNTLGEVASDGQIIVGTGAGAFAYESGDTARTSLGLGTSDSPTFNEPIVKTLQLKDEGVVYTAIATMPTEGQFRILRHTDNIGGILDFSGITTPSKTFTFPNTAGTISLTSNILGTGNEIDVTDNGDGTVTIDLSDIVNFGNSV
jgi:photosystem II stability/assembly factor-like uncharacterized protein